MFVNRASMNTSPFSGKHARVQCRRVQPENPSLTSCNSESRKIHREIPDNPREDCTCIIQVATQAHTELQKILLYQLQDFFFLIPTKNKLQNFPHACHSVEFPALLTIH